MNFDSAIINTIRNRAKSSEMTGELSPEILEYIYEHRLFKLFVPKELGGDMKPLPEAIRIFEEASKIDSSFGWLVTIGAGGGFFVPSLSEKACREIFLGQDAVIAGSGQATGKAVKTDGGYIVTGDWRYCSGAMHATAFTANCVIEDHDGKEDGKIRSVAFTPEQISIIKDWNTIGLKGTGSHTIAAENAFVPDERTFSIFEKISYVNEPLYSFPFLQFSQASFAAIAIGITRHFFEEAGEMIAERAAGWDVIPTRSQLAMERVEIAQKAFNEKVVEYYEGVEKVWDKHIAGETITEEEEHELSSLCIDTAAQAREAINTVFPYLGMDVVKEGNMILSIWKDIHTASQHLLLSPLFK